MAEESYKIETIESDPFAQNAYVVWRDGSSEALVFDPGFAPRPILELLRRYALYPAMILDTHGHVDHIAGNAALKEAFPDAPLVIGRNDAAALQDPDLNLSATFGIPVISPPADRLVEHGELFDAAGFAIEVREIPGHSPGSVAYVFSGESPSFVIGGDVLFAGSIGRTDLGGNLGQLMSGIEEKLLDLPDETLVYSGHGPATTIGRERRSNPYILQYAPFRRR